MIKNGHKTSLLIPSQLPEFIRDNPDYDKFVAFLQAYYEWMEQNGNAIERSKNILEYADIDRTSEEFINYYLNEFLPSFPSDALVDKRLAIKVAKQLYEVKGTPASFQFLFRTLYDSDFEVFYTKDVILKASGGEWYVPKSFRLSTSDTRFLKTKKLKVFGERSGATAVIENPIVSENKIEIFISAIQRDFESGENIIVVDNSNQIVYFDSLGNIVSNTSPGSTSLSAKIVGQINQITIDPQNKGLLYKPGDPVVIYGGITPDAVNPVEATAVVGDTTKGSIQRIAVIGGGYGYRTDPNTKIKISNIQGASARVFSVDPSDSVIANVTVARDTISLKRFTTIGNSNYSFANGYIFVVSANNTNPNTFTAGERVYQGNTLANSTFISTVRRFDANSNTLFLNTSDGLPANGLPIIGVSSGSNRTIIRLNGANSNTTLANALSYINFLTYPLSSIVVDVGGGSVTSKPDVFADSIYPTDSPAQINDEEFGIAHIGKLGILAPIQIINGGVGYQANDRIVFSGGSGFGAFANVTSVRANGAINTVSYVYGTYISSRNNYPLGGLGYRNDALPSLSVNSANVQAANASLVVLGTLGNGATLDPTTDTIGTISSIVVTNLGEDYSSRPNVSIRVQDVLTKNVNINFPPKKNDIAFQGANINVATFIASVDSIKLIVPYQNPLDSQYTLRLFEYNGVINTSQNIKILNKNINLIPANTSVSDTQYNDRGIIIYGDGRAKATASFLNGLNLGKGQYLSSKSLLNSDDILQNGIYNNYTYILTVQKEIEKYRETLLNLLHPSGLKVLGRYSVKANSKYYFHELDASYQGYPLKYYTGYPGATATITTNFTNKTNNIIKFNDLAGANISSFIFDANNVNNASIIQLTSPKGINVWSRVIRVDPIGNNVTISDNVVLTFANVAIAKASAGSNLINIVTLTGEYDLYNNGEYNDKQFPLKDIVYIGDTIRIGGNTGVVQSINYVTGTITLSTNFAANANTLMSVARAVTFDSISQIRILGTIGTQYYPELITEDGRTLLTEDDLTIILG